MQSLYLPQQLQSHWPWLQLVQQSHLVLLHRTVDVVEVVVLLVLVFVEAGVVVVVLVLVGQLFTSPLIMPDWILLPESEVLHQHVE